MEALAFPVLFWIESAQLPKLFSLFFSWFTHQFAPLNFSCTAAHSARPHHYLPGSIALFAVLFGIIRHILLVIHAFFMRLPVERFVRIRGIAVVLVLYLPFSPSLPTRSSFTSSNKTPHPLQVGHSVTGSLICLVKPSR